MDAAAAATRRERSAARTKGSSVRARASIPPTAGEGIASSKSNTQRVPSLPSRRANANAGAATNDAIKNGARPATAPVNSEEGEVVGLPGLSSLNVADAVVTEYEKLLAAVPTMARHMGKLQLDTEVMAEGLERRVRSLVDGYRELNELVDQAPVRVSDAASEYAQALGLRRTQGSPLLGDGAGMDGSDEALDVEGIHRELFALKEAKIALDAAIMLAPTDPTQRQQRRGALDRHSTSSARVANRASRGVQGVSRRSGITAVAGGGGERSYRRTVAAVAAGARAGTRGGRAGDVAAAAVAAAGGVTRRPSDRRALVEMQVDPDRPLPLPTFPGHGKLLGGEAKHHSNNHHQQQAPSGNSLPGDLKHPGSGGGGGEADQPGEGHYHGYFVPGVVAPKQRQSHGLPRELRAISTIPTPEKRPASRATASASGQRRRVRSRSALAQPPSARRAAAVPVAPPLPRQPAEATAIGPGSGGYGVSASRPDPGSSAALASARDQRRSTRRAVDALRKEMLEREARLERELDRLRDSRSQRAASAAVAETGPASKAAPSPKATPAPAIGKRRGSTAAAGGGGGGRGRGASRGRRRAPPSSRVQAPKQKPAGAGAGAVSRDSVGEEAEGADNDDEEGGRGSRPVARSVDTADAQAQTAADGVQLFLHPQPAIREALRVPANQPSPEGHAVGAHQQTRSTGNVVEEHYYLDDASFLSSVSGGGEEDGSGLGRQLGGRLHVSPPGPVVFVEGEGRNRYWRPADDDRLLRGEGGSSAAAFGATSATGASGAEALHSGDARLILAAKEDNDDGRPEREIRLTTGRLEAAAVAPESVQDGAWVELAGMLAMSAAPPTARPSISETLSGEGQAGKSSTEAAAASPELLDLMREVVGQQREMGEERREEEGKSGSADGGQGEQQLVDRPTPTDRFWPITSEHDAAELAEESGSGTNGEGSGMGVQGQGVAAAKVVAVRDDGGTEEEKGEAGGVSAQQPPPQTFRSNLGRLLAAGSGWKDVPLEEDGDGAAEKVFKTSLGRALAGGPGGALKGEAGVLGVGGGANSGSSRTGTSRAAGEPDVQELLWEAGRRGDTGALSPETAVRKRASALESRRFLSAVSESEAKRCAEERDGGLSSPGSDVDGDSEAEALEQEARAKSAREGRHRHPPPDSPLPVSSTSRQQEQQQLQPQQDGQGGERLHLSLATAVLSVAQRLSAVEERALARAEGAEGLARQAMEETRKEGADGRQRQSEVMHRLEEMEHGSEKRARVVAREIAELREEGRLERQRISQLQQTRGNRSGEAEALGVSNAGRDWSSGGGGGPRPHLTLLMSAHPRLKRGGNRGSSRGGHVKAPLHAQTDDGKGCSGGVAGSGGGGRRRGSRSLGGPFPGTVRENGDGGLRRPGFPEQSAGLGVEIGGGVGGDAGSPSLSDSGQSLEPGQTAQRLSWHGDDARRGLGVASGGVGVAGASWLRHHISTASEGTGSCSAGEASSGAEMGEAPPALSEEDLDGFLEEGGGREWDRSSRPMVALKVGNRPGRRRQTEIQRAVAEAELDLCTATGVDYYRDLAQSTELLAAEPAGKENGGPAEGSDTAAVVPAGQLRDPDDGVVGEDKEAFSPEQKDSGRAERQELEPGEVP
ncbi:hypothetical protein Esi_0012_0173 [Ectocarpus siliculosus]|uniref:Uncharacterized protein n=1 Tax=Ectocarpus siliculosus TaxID=2880 RepID=D8LDL5_ECTSI|nr:hypothetical protein Esi_0012_0173 [Ectocarpus siliculosus]|eukprot:CBN74090.1 hypothetical protein Esi_0012_0173 [Ectocarpus siliculosus]